MSTVLLSQPHTSNVLKAVHEYPRKMGIKFHKIFIHVHVPYHPGGGGGGVFSPKFLLGVCGSFHENLTRFQTKISEVPNPISDLNLKSTSILPQIIQVCI